MPPANPTAAPVEMMAVPTRGSKPTAVAKATPMGMKTMVSSDMPKDNPPREKTNIVTGISNFSLPFNINTIFDIPASIAPVA